METAKGKGTAMVPLSLYDQCKQNDIIALVAPLLAGAGYRLRDGDGKIYADTYMAFETPWHHIYHADGLDCHLWHKIIFDTIFTRLGKQMVPMHCQQCWKVVVRPKTLKGLFALMNLQMQLGMPSKCGIEVRDTVHGLYGGYFYNKSLPQGVQCLRTVRGAVDQTEDLGPETKILLKRACTEFEALVGDSDAWEVSDEQRAIENLVHRTFVRDIMQRTQPDHAIAHVHRKWIEWAYAMGDPTFAEYTNGQPIHKPYVTWNNLADKTDAELEKLFKQLANGKLTLTDIRDQAGA